MGQILINFLSGLFRVPRFIKADMSGPAAQFVRETIAKNKVVIFSKSYCPYCTMAKEVCLIRLIHILSLFLTQK